MAFLRSCFEHPSQIPNSVRPGGFTDHADGHPPLLATSIAPPPWRVRLQHGARGDEFALGGLAARRDRIAEGVGRPRHAPATQSALGVVAAGFALRRTFPETASGR